MKKKTLMQKYRIENREYNAEIRKQKIIKLKLHL
jgi:hypothetical protein